jgi:hypothetical protein
MLFIISLFIPPGMNGDSAAGFFVFRSMLAGGPFNYFTEPDPSNIANDIAVFQTLLSPGQYLVPGLFVWLGADYGLAISLTVLIATVIGVLGWMQVARSFDVSPFVLHLFLFGLVTFRYVTAPFRFYNGGEVLLFAVLPWSLHALRWVATKPAASCFAISVLSAALLFFVKLTGLVAFAANVLAIGFLDLFSRRKLTSSSLAMYAGSVVAALLFSIFWLAKGPVAAAGLGLSFTWLAVLFPVAGATFSGFSLFDLLHWLLLEPSPPLLPNLFVPTYILGTLGLVLMGWVWFRLRDTRYRQMATCLFTIILLFATAFVAMYVQESSVSFEERHLRYAGILFFLLLLVALDRRAPLSKVIAILIVGMFGVYGLTSFVNGERELLRGHHYDPVSGTSQLVVSPVVLEYLRSEMATHNWDHAIAVLPWLDAAVALPRFRIIGSLLDYISLEQIASRQWFGRTEKIFVVVQEKMRTNGKADTLLKSFVDYDFEAWRHLELDGMIVYSQ